MRNFQIQTTPLMYSFFVNEIYRHVPESFLDERNVSSVHSTCILEGKGFHRVCEKCTLLSVPVYPLKCTRCTHLSVPGVPKKKPYNPISFLNTFHYFSFGLVGFFVDFAGFFPWVHRVHL